MFCKTRVTFTLLLTTLAIGNAWATAPQGWGRVSMKGEILETACAIDTLSRDQTITMATVPASQIARDVQGVAHPFVVKLVKCTLKRLDPKLPDWSHFRITFDGLNDGGQFGVEGQAKGVALQIADAQGNVATPGKQMPSAPIVPNDMALTYSLRLVSNQQVLKAGDYYSTVRFKMDYY